MGTSQDDIFLGDNATVSGADSVNGGDGTDTLRLFGVNAAGVPTMTSIENLELHNVNPGDVDLTGTNFSDVTKLTLDGFVAAAQTVTIKSGDTLRLVDVTGAGDVNVSAASTITSIALEAGGNIGLTTDLVEVDVNATGLTSVSLALSGAKNFVTLDTAGSTGVETITITGAGTGTIQVGPEAETINASATTGGITIQGDFADDVTITAGSGNDKIVAAAEISSKDVIDGGAGEDTLSVTANFSAKTGTITNIEVIELAATAADQTIDVDDAFAGITKFVVSGNGATAERKFLIDDAASGSTITILTVDPDATDDDDITVDLKTDGTADVLNFNIGSATVAASFDALTADDAETVNIALGAKDGHSINDLDFADATSVVVTGAGNATLAGIALKAATNTFDASAATGDLTLTFEGTQTQTIKTGSGKDTVTLSDANVSAFDVFDLGAGTDTLKITDIGAALTATINAINTETLILETASGGSVSVDVSKMVDLSTIVIDDAGMTSNVTLNFVKSGATVQFLDIDDTTAQTHTVTGVVGAAAVTIEVDAVDEENTIAVNNFTAITLAQKSNTLSGTSAATDLADFNSGDATTLAITSANNALTLRDLSTSKLVTLTVSGSTDVTLSSGGSTTIKTINASTLDGVNNGAELVLGSGALFARAADATIIGSDGADTISMSASATTHAGNVIDAGDNATVDATVKGDNLVLYGAMTGDTVINLSSTTDQVVSLSGVANAAVQKGFESFDGSNASMVSTAKYVITGSSGINHIVGGTGADVIDAGAGADIIRAKTGLDVVTTGDGADIVILSAGDGYVTITDFTVGTGGDAIGFDAGVVTTTGTGAFLAVTAAGAINTGTDGVFAVKADTGTAGLTMTAAQVETALVSAFTNIDATEKGIALITADTDANSTVYVYQFTSTGGTDIDSVDLLAVLLNVELDNLTAANVDGFT